MPEKSLREHLQELANANTVKAAAAGALPRSIDTHSEGKEKLRDMGIAGAGGTGGQRRPRRKEAGSEAYDRAAAMKRLGRVAALSKTERLLRMRALRPTLTAQTV